MRGVKNKEDRPKALELSRQGMKWPEIAKLLPRVSRVCLIRWRKAEGISTDYKALRSEMRDHKAKAIALFERGLKASAIAKTLNCGVPIPQIRRWGAKAGFGSKNSNYRNGAKLTALHTMAQSWPGYLTQPRQQRACFHHSNLRPMWRTANRRKSDKIETCQPELLISLCD